MTFSVITPSYNCKEFIAENFRSIREQGCGPDQLEHWIIDGGSTDGTVDILKATEGIHWVSERDRGLSDAVNKGIQRAKGEWIIWLNADDVLAKDACRTFLEYAEKNPGVRIFSGDLVFLRSDGTEEQRVDGWDYNLDDLLGRRTGINQPSTFVHRDVYQKVGMIDPLIKCAMDYEWVVRAMHHYSCVHIPHVLSYSRRRAGSITDAHMAAHFEEFLRQRRKYGRSYFALAEWEIRFFIWTDPLRRIQWLRRCVRKFKGLFGREPLHPM